MARVEAACAGLAQADTRAASEATLLALRATPLAGGGAASMQAVLQHSHSAEAMFHAAGAFTPHATPRCALPPDAASTPEGEGAVCAVSPRMDVITDGPVLLPPALRAAAHARASPHPRTPSNASSAHLSARAVRAARDRGQWRVSRCRSWTRHIGGKPLCSAAARRNPNLRLEQSVVRVCWCGGVGVVRVQRRCVRGWCATGRVWTSRSAPAYVTTAPPPP